MLGAKYYIFHGPRLMSYDENQWPMIVTRMKLLAELANEYNISIAQENVSWCVSSQVEFIKYLNQQNIHNLYFTLDNKQAVKSMTDSTLLIKVMGDKLVNVHISDIKKPQSGIFPLQGDFDFNTFFEELKCNNYKGPVMIEVYGKFIPEDLEKEFKHFKELYF